MYVCESLVTKHSHAHFFYSVYLPVLLHVLTHLTTQRHVCGFFAHLQACRQRHFGQDRENLGRIDWRMPERLTESPKLQIIFHKRATKYRSLLRK